jgi:hypothetical protein
MNNIEFNSAVKSFALSLEKLLNSKNKEWIIKGLISDENKIYSLNSDTKIISKLLEIQIFPNLLVFANKYDFQIVLAEHQNFYPDISFVYKKNNKIKYALDIKTTYRKNEKACNGFTLGSHGKYFIERDSKKNIQFPYSEYQAHYCLGIIYDRAILKAEDQNQIYSIKEISKIKSVIKNFSIFCCEKWKLASDKGGSGNTANIGSINNIENIINEKGMFHLLGIDWFDQYWMNYNKEIYDKKSKSNVKIKDLLTFVKIKNGDVSKIFYKKDK